MASEPIAQDDWPDAEPAAGEPVGVSDRLITLDFIRGIAVLGILVANIVAFSAPQVAYSWPGAYPQPMSRADEWVWLVQYLLIDGKMRGLFSLLFGAGMLLFMERAWARGASRWLQARRLLWLMLFGLAHFYLLFWGDILYLYGFAGLVGLLFVRFDGSRLLWIGLAWYLAGALFLSTVMGLQALAEHAGPADPGASETYASNLEDIRKETDKGRRELQAFTQGSYPAEVAFNAREHSSQLAQNPVFSLLETVPWMLIGMGLYRAGLFNGGLDPRKQRKWGWIGLATGLALTLPLGLWAMEEGFPFFLTRWVFDGIGEFPRLPMVLGLAALLALWAPKAARGWLGARLVAAGRMAFSNYIGTSVVMMLVFRHWAFGLFGELSRVELLGVVLFGWVLILAWSKPWLAHFRYGPLEWCWRRLTYWRRFPFMR